MIQQGAVKLNGERVTDLVFQPVDGIIIQVGKGNMFKLTASQETTELGKKFNKKILKMAYYML